MKPLDARITREYGPFPDVDRVHGVSFDGRRLWFASGGRLHAIDPASGLVRRTVQVSADAGTAWDGRHLYQIAAGRIQTIDPHTGRVLATVPAPGGTDSSGLAWAEGFLWVGEHRAGKIHQVEPRTGRVVRTLETGRFVTGVTWAGGDLWHGTWEGDRSGIRRIDRHTGATLEALTMPAGTGVSGLASDGADQFFCGGGGSGTVRVVRRG